MNDKDLNNELLKIDSSKESFNNSLLKELMKVSIYADNEYADISGYIDANEEYMRGYADTGLLQSLQEYLTSNDTKGAAKEFIEQTSSDAVHNKNLLALSADIKRLDTLIDLITTNMPHMTIWLERVNVIKDVIVNENRTLSHSELIELSDIYKRVK